jgi:hypothetical protein
LSYLKQLSLSWNRKRSRFCYEILGFKQLTVTTTDGSDHLDYYLTGRSLKQISFGPDFKNPKDMLRIGIHREADDQVMGHFLSRLYILRLALFDLLNCVSRCADCGFSTAVEWLFCPDFGIEDGPIGVATLSGFRWG